MEDTQTNIEWIDFETKVWLTLPWKAISPDTFVKERPQLRLSYQAELVYISQL